MKDETVKDSMGHNIPLDSWEQMWKTNIKITKAASFKENLYKMFYRWHLTPDEVAKKYKETSNKY